MTLNLLIKAVENVLSIDIETHHSLLNIHCIHKSKKLIWYLNSNVMSSDSLNYLVSHKIGDVIYSHSGHRLIVEKKHLSSKINKCKHITQLLLTQLLLNYQMIKNNIQMLGWTSCEKVYWKHSKCHIEIGITCNFSTPKNYDEYNFIQYLLESTSFRNTKFTLGVQDDGTKCYGFKTNFDLYEDSELQLISDLVMLKLNIDKLQGSGKS